MQCARIVYCPGLDGNAREIEPLLPLLPEAEITAVAYPELARSSFEDLAHLVVSRLRESPRGARLLCGNSFGGALSIMTALLHPREVDALCLIATFNHEPEPFAAELGRKAVKLLPKAVLKPITRVLANWKLAGKLQGEDREKFLHTVTSVDPHVMAARLELLKGFDVRMRLREIRIPVQVVFAARDPISGDTEQLEPWRHMLHSEVDGISECGHVIPREQPGKLAAIVRKWLLRACAGVA
jgi:pimeloyl-ACP methyl ester carboxylesterase